MFIVGKTEEGDVVYWNGDNWSYDMEDAESYGAFRGNFKLGELEVEYLDDYDPKLFRGMRIVAIRGID